MKLNIFLLVLAAFLNHRISASDDEEFTYFEEGGLGPSNWAKLDLAEENQCGGTMGASAYGQSPVTIDEATTQNCDTGMSQYSFTAGDCQWTDLDFLITKGGVKVVPKIQDCSLGSMKIPHSQNEFNALHFHIHAGSEHQILGEGENGFFSAEMHVVHEEETAESFAVFGSMIIVGNDDHPIFELLLQGWEAAALQVEEVCLAETSVLDNSESIVTSIECPAIGSSSPSKNATNPSFPEGGPNVYNLVNSTDFGTYTYKGGLTTPPCTEIVNWNVVDTPIKISEGQLKRLQSLILCYVSQHHNDDGTLNSCGYGTVATASGSTARPTQALLGRKVLHRCPGGPEVVIADVGVTQEDALASGSGFVESQNKDVASNSYRLSTTVSTSFITLLGAGLMVAAFC